MHYNFFRINYLKLSILIFGFLLAGGIYGDTKEAVWVSIVFLGGSFVIDFMYWLEKRMKNERSTKE